ncbi:MAG: acyltransferase family protein [Oscillospiraceae bacterium]|nr:acyltransferase family protein [Oscillospiraceae bacterium]
MGANAVKTGTGRRYIDLDAVRIIAILLALFVHSGGRGCYRFLDVSGSWTYWPHLANAIFSCAAVPLFFMASGALLLDREESYRGVLRRFLRFLAVLLLASALQYLWQFRGDLQRVYLDYYLRTVYASYMTDGYWYLYSYLGYLLVLPLLRRLARTMTDRDFLYLLLVYAGLKLLEVPVLLHWQGELTLNPSLQVFTAGDYVFYPLMGYYFHCRADLSRVRGRPFGCLLLASLAALALSCLLVWYAYRVGAPEPGIYYRSFLYLVVFTVFCGMQLLFARGGAGPKLARILRELSGCCFGIYLFEDFFMAAAEPVYRGAKPVIGVLPACWLWLAVTFLLGGACVWLLRKIPGVNKLI